MKIVAFDTLNYLCVFSSDQVVFVSGQLKKSTHLCFQHFPSKILFCNIMDTELLFFSLRYSILSGNERMTFMMEPDTGVLSLSNKRRQGMKLSYQLNVSVSDGVFTNTAQVRQLPRQLRFSSVN